MKLPHHLYCCPFCKKVQKRGDWADKFAQYCDHGEVGGEIHEMLEYSVIDNEITNLGVSQDEQEFLKIFHNFLRPEKEKMSDNVISFPKSKRHAPELTGDECQCVPCIGKREMLQGMRMLAPATASDAENQRIVRDYDKSLQKGLGKWEENPGSSLFDAINEQLIIDGIVRV